MRGLDGAEKRKCWKTISFCMFFWGSKKPRGDSENEHFSEMAIFACPNRQNGDFCMPRIVLPAKAGSTFSKNHEKTLSGSARWSQKTLDGKYDCYMRGLDGAEKRKCWKTIGFCMFFWRSKKPKGDSPNEQLSESGAKITKMAIFACQELCFLLRQGAHFQKIMKKRCQKMKNGAKRR